MLSSSYGRPQNGYNYNVPTTREANFLGSSSINYHHHQLNPFVGDQFGVQQTAFSNNVIGNHVQHNGGLFGSDLNSIGGPNQFAPQPTLVHKHIYVHVPPPEPEEELRVAQSQLAPATIPQKHYKIIFIKAPSAAPSIVQQQQQQLALASQNEEKTIVYVLVKKPELDSNELAAASTPIGVTAPANKPEVYFIKYKTQKDGFERSAASNNQINAVSATGLLNTVVPLPGKGIERKF